MGIHTASNISLSYTLMRRRHGEQGNRVAQALVNMSLLVDCVTACGMATLTGALQPWRRIPYGNVCLLRTECFLVLAHCCVCFWVSADSRWC